MPITQAQPLGSDQKRCLDCNGFGVECSSLTGRLYQCSPCRGTGIMPNGEPLVDPALPTEKGHGID